MAKCSDTVLSVRSLSKSYVDTTGSERQVLKEISIDLLAGDFLCIIGSSGIGKTTLLRIMAGLLTASSGEVLASGGSVLMPGKESVLVLQEYGRSLLPWRNVAENVQLGLEARRFRRRDRHEQAREALSTVGLSEFMDFFPWQLSGGMQQRVALARALACRPKVLLMDEPFGSLDSPTRQRLEDELLRIWAERELTVVFVTHDLDEAIYLGRRIALMRGIPASLKQLGDVPIGYPRSQLHTRELPAFLNLRADLYRALELQC
jgi:NitT/TauT family transport system ATP-binding protein